MSLYGFPDRRAGILRRLLPNPETYRTTAQLRREVESLLGPLVDVEITRCVTDPAQAFLHIEAEAPPDVWLVDLRAENIGTKAFDVLIGLLVAREIRSVTAVLPARTGTEWFKAKIAHNIDSAVFLRGRIREPGYKTSCPDPVVIVCFEMQDALTECPITQRPATSMLMGEGRVDVVAQSARGEVRIFDPRLAQKIEDGAEFCATIRSRQ